MNATVQPKQTETKPNHDQIALLAYGLWERNGCKPGHDLDYWLEAEKQVNGSNRSALQQRPAADPVRKPAVTRNA